MAMPPRGVSISELLCCMAAANETIRCTNINTHFSTFHLLKGLAGFRWHASPEKADHPPSPPAHFIPVDRLPATLVSMAVRPPRQGVHAICAGRPRAWLPCRFRPRQHSSCCAQQYAVGKAPPGGDQQLPIQEKQEAQESYVFRSCRNESSLRQQTFFPNRSRRNIVTRHPCDLSRSCTDGCIWQQ